MLFKRKNPGRQAAQEALRRVRQLQESGYPLLIVVGATMIEFGIELKPGESWPLAIARNMGLPDLPCLIKFCDTILEKGVLPPAGMTETEPKKTVAAFSSWAALKLITEEELSTAGMEAHT